MKNQERIQIKNSIIDTIPKKKLKQIRIQHSILYLKSAQIWLCFTCKTLTFNCQRRRCLGLVFLSVCLLHFSMQINTSSALARMSEFQPRADRPAYRNSAHCAQFCATLLYAIFVSQSWYSVIVLCHSIVLYYRVTHSTLQYHCPAIFFYRIVLDNLILLHVYTM